MAQHDDKEAERAAREYAKKAELVEAQINSFVLSAFGDSNGRAFLWWLLQIGRVGLQPFTADPYRTAFSCGELNVGQQILAKLTEVSPAGYISMMKEHSNDGNSSSPDAEPEPGDSDPGSSGPFTEPGSYT